MKSLITVAAFAVLSGAINTELARAGVPETYTTYCVFNGNAEKCIHTVTPDGYHRHG